MCQRLEVFFEEYAPGLDSQTIAIYCALETKAGQLGKDEFYLSNSDLMKMSGVNSKNTLKKRLHLLSSLGLINYQRQRGRGLATIYILKKGSCVDPFKPEKGSSGDSFGKKGSCADPFKPEKGSSGDPLMVHDYDYDHDLVVKKLSELGMNGDGEKYVRILGVKRSKELLRIALEKANNPGAYFRVLAEKEINSKSDPKQQNRSQKEEDEDEFIKFWKRRWEWVLAQKKDSKTITTEKVDVPSLLRDTIEQIKKGS